MTKPKPAARGSAEEATRQIKRYDAWLAEDIATLRRRGWSVREIATQLGISRATLYRIEAEAEEWT